MRLNRAIAGSLIWVSAVSASQGMGQKPDAAKAERLKKADAAFRAGYAARQNGNLELSREKFAEVVKLAPQIAEGHEALGAVLLEMNRAPEAVAELEAAERLKPGDAGNEANLALGYAAAGEAAKAIPHFEAAVRGRELAGPADVRLLDTYGRALAAVGKKDAAIAEFETEEKVGGETAGLEDAIGSLYALEQKWDEARRRFEHALTLDPSLASARVHLGVVLRAQGDLAGSLTALEGVAKADPPDASAQYEYGRTLAAASRDEDAVGEFEGALKGNEHWDGNKRRFPGLRRWWRSSRRIRVRGRTWGWRKR